MAIIGLEIRDDRLLKFSAHGVSEELCLAYIQTDGVQFGDSAWQHYRLAPHQCYSQYWQQLSYQAIANTNNNVQHFADLAYQQLLAFSHDITADDDVILLVPGYYQQAQLSLLLGICQACQLNIVGIVDAALLRAVALSSVGKVKVAGDYLLIGGHQLELTTLTQEGQLTVTASTTVADKGLFALYRFIAQRINQLYIREFRFDIGDHAEVEQQLWLSLSEIISTTQTSYLLELADKTVTLAQTTIQSWIAEFFDFSECDWQLEGMVCADEALSRAIRASVPALAAVDLLTVELVYQQLCDNYSYLCTAPDIVLIKALATNDKSSKNSPVAEQNVNHSLYILIGDTAYSLQQSPWFINDGVGLSLSRQKQSESVLEIVVDNQQLLVLSLPTEENGEPLEQLLAELPLRKGAQITLLDGQIHLTLIAVSSGELS